MYNEMEDDMKELGRNQREAGKRRVVDMKKRATHAFILYAAFVSFATISTAVIGIAVAMANQTIAWVFWIPAFFWLLSLVPAGVIVDRWGVWDD